MPLIKPFKAVRATRDKVALVSSKSYEAYSNGKINAKLEYNPFTFLHIINPGYKYHKEVTGEQRFKLVHNRFLEFKEENIFIQDKHPAFYIYKKITPKNSFCGIIAATSVKDYQHNLIKKHEATLHQREILFETYLKNTGFNAEPVLLTYQDDKNIATILQSHQQKRAEYEFTTSDKNTHLLWVIDKAKDIETIQNAFQKTAAFYIADGHHRSSSSCLLAKSLAKENPNHTGNEAYNYFMSYLIPESHLKISEFNRFVKDLNGLSVDDFLMELDTYFRIENKGQELYRPSKKHHFSMYLEGNFYALYLRKTVYQFTDALSKLDTEILYRTILKPILEIKNVKNNNRLSYIDGKKEDLSLKTNVDNGNFKVSFGMLPITVDELKKIADEGSQMPPKSTYIQPKLRSGLTIYEF